jgi:hypothetical protein
LAFATITERVAEAGGATLAGAAERDRARPVVADAPAPASASLSDAAAPQAGSGQTLVIACGALAREIVDLVATHHLDRIAVTCLPAIWHNTPEKIPEGVRAKIRAARAQYARIVVAYGDCGTGGLLDRVLEEEGVTRIDGPHCYQFYMGTADFTARAEAEPGCFFLTDYLARHFDRLIVEGLGLDRHPELRDDYFGNYTTLVYLAQTDDAALDAAARRGAERLGLAYERRMTGYGELGDFIRAAGTQQNEGAR